jgi:bifunctional non-homologous end joining protein LigD
MPITITNAGRVVVPETGHTKGEVVAYYERAASRLLPHLERRPLTLRRYPRGVAQPGFFQKNVPDSYPQTMARVELPKHGGVTIHPCVDRPEHLVFLANQGVIELHVPTVRTPELDRPDRFIIDLDPPEGAATLVARAAVLLREELAGFGLPTVPVATGSKGYHVVGAITPTVESDVLAGVAQKLGALIAERHPDVFTNAFRVAKREGRVFVDWMRNRAPSTVVSPFSLRARPRAGIAMPFEWSEIGEVKPDTFHLGNVDSRLERDDSLVVLGKSPVDPQPFVDAVLRAFDESGLELEHFDRFRS